MKIGIQVLAKRMPKINNLIAETVKENEKYISDLQRQQLRAGLTSKGDFISPSYSSNYAYYKSMKSSYHAPLGTPDLFLTGAFQKGIRLKVAGKEYELDSSDSKVGKLTGKYDSIFGLHKGSKKLAKVKNSKTIGKKLKDALGL